MIAMTLEQFEDTIQIRFFGFCSYLRSERGGQHMKKMMKEGFERTNHPMLKVTAVGLAILIGAGLYQGTKEEVQLVVDGQEQKILTHKENVREVVEMMGYSLENYEVTPAVETSVEDGLKVIIEPKRTITVKVDGKEVQHVTTAKTVEEALVSQGVLLASADQTFPEKTTKITDNLEIEVSRAFPVTVQDGNKKKVVQTVSTTVADFLKEQNIEYDSNDKITPKLTEILHANDTVKVVRIQKITDVVEETIAIQTEKRTNAKLVSGTTKVVRKGSVGKVERTYEITKENGKITSKKLIDQNITKEMVTKVVHVGTKNPSRGDVAGAELVVTATAYTPYCSGCSGKTATGIDLRENPDMKLIAVDPSVIPLGTKVYVEGYGYAVAGDIGGSIQGNKIDILMPNKQAAYRWGVKTVKVRIIG